MRRRSLIAQSYCGCKPKCQKSYKGRDFRLNVGKAVLRRFIRVSKHIKQIWRRKKQFGGKITVNEKDYKKVTSLAKKQLVDESKEKKLSKEISALRKENKSLKTENEGMKTLLNSQQSVSKRLSTAMMESELRELRIFKERAEKFLSEHGLSDYFRKAFIHSNNRDL